MEGNFLNCLFLYVSGGSGYIYIVYTYNQSSKFFCELELFIHKIKAFAPVELLELSVKTV